MTELTSPHVTICRVSQLNTVIDTLTAFKGLAIYGGDTNLRYGTYHIDSPTHPPTHPTTHAVAARSSTHRALVGLHGREAEVKSNPKYKTVTDAWEAVGRSVGCCSRCECHRPT